MAFVAFDLDNTLGFFELTNPLAYLWSPEFLNNPEQARPNGLTAVTPRLAKKLKRARDIFAGSVVADPELLNIILRPNLSAIMEPILAARKRRRLRTVIIYSNTSVTYSMELAKGLIERAYKAPNLFSIMADHWHPSRTADRHAPLSPRPHEYVEPQKTIETLQRLFREATGVRGHIPLKNIMFVDDRQPKHMLQAQEGAGLTYLVPTHYYPKATKDHKKVILLYAMEAMDRAGLLGDKEYLSSGFCNRDIPYDWTKIRRIRGFPDLFTWVWEEIESVTTPKERWQPDTMTIGGITRNFFAALEKS